MMKVFFERSEKFIAIARTIIMSRKGFSLTELMIAVAVLAIMAGIGSTTYVRQLSRGRDQQRIADIRKMQVALERYRAEYGQYPPRRGFGDWPFQYCDSSIGHLSSPPTDCGDPFTGTPDIDWETNSKMRYLAPDYMDELPVDPVNNTDHYYGFNQSCDSNPIELCGMDTHCANTCCAYELSVRLESGEVIRRCGL